MPLDENERKILESTNHTNWVVIHETAIQKADTWAGALVAEVFGMFIIFSLVQAIVPWPSSNSYEILARDGLLFVASIIIAAMIAVTYVRMYHQNIIAVRVSELTDLLDDQAKFDGVVNELAKSRFSFLASWSIMMTGHPRGVPVIGVLIFSLLWIATIL